MSDQKEEDSVSTATKWAENVVSTVTKWVEEVAFVDSDALTIKQPCLGPCSATPEPIPRPPALRYFSASDSWCGVPYVPDLKDCEFSYRMLQTWIQEKNLQLAESTKAWLRVNIPILCGKHVLEFIEKLDFPQGSLHSLWLRARQQRRLKGLSQRKKRKRGKRRQRSRRPQFRV